MGLNLMKMGSLFGKILKVLIILTWTVIVMLVAHLIVSSITQVKIHTRCEVKDELECCDTYSTWVGNWLLFKSKHCYHENL